MRSYLCFAGLTSDGYLCADGQPTGSKDYEEHQYVNTQNLDKLNRDGGDSARGGRPPDSPKKDLFDMSESYFLQFRDASWSSLRVIL